MDLQSVTPDKVVESPLLYEPPTILVTYAVEDLVAEAAVCMGYGHAYGRGHGKGGPPAGVNPPGLGKRK